MATHGRGEVAWVLGSVAEKVVSHATVPVLLFRVLGMKPPKTKTDFLDYSIAASPEPEPEGCRTQARFFAIWRKLIQGEFHAEKRLDNFGRTGPGRGGGHPALGGAFLCRQAGGGHRPDAPGRRPGHDPPRRPQGLHGHSRRASPFLAFYILWGIWVGWIFSSVGAFGGIMAGVGHISVFGLSDYATSFKKTSPTLNKMMTDSIRTSNQYLVGLSALISSFTYYRMGRLVLPLGLCLAVGGILAGYLVPLLTVGKINVSTLCGFLRDHRLCRSLCALLRNHP